MNKIIDVDKWVKIDACAFRNIIYIYIYELEIGSSQFQGADAKQEIDDFDQHRNSKEEK